MSKLLFDVGRAAINTSIGTQDFTISGLGWTPKAAFLQLVGSNAADETQIAHARACFGFVDGTNQRCYAIRANNGEGTTSDTYRMASNSACVMFLDGSGAQAFDAHFDSFISNGIRLDWDTAPGAAFYLIYYLFGGDSLTFTVGDFTSNATEDAATTVSLGSSTQKPDIVLIGGCDSSGWAESTESHSQIGLGFATRNLSTDAISQRAHNNLWEDNVTLSTSGDAGFVWSSGTYCGGTIDTAVAPSTLGPSIEMTDMSTVGEFEVTTRNDSVATRWMYLAIQGGAQGHAFVRDTPTGSVPQDQVFTEPGFATQGFLHIGTNRLQDDNIANNSNADMISIGGAGRGSGTEAAGMASIDVGADPTYTRSVVYTGPCYYRFGGGSGAGVNDVVDTWDDPDGWTQTWEKLVGNPQKHSYLAFAQPTPGVDQGWLVRSIHKRGSRRKRM